MLGNKEESGTYYYIKLRGTKKLETPFWSVTQKDADGKYPEIKQVGTISGQLLGIKHDEYEFEGDKVKTFKMEIRDKDEVYIVSLGYNMLTRNMLNSLAACDNITNVELSVFTDKKSGYARLYTKVNGGKTDWKFDQETLKGMVEQVKNKRGEIVSTDTTELDSFFQRVIDEHILPKLTGAIYEAPQDNKEEVVQASIEAQTPKTVPAKGRKQSEPIEDSDLPF